MASSKPLGLGYLYWISISEARTTPSALLTKSKQEAVTVLIYVSDIIYGGDQGNMQLIFSKSLKLIDQFLINLCF